MTHNLNSRSQFILLTAVCTVLFGTIVIPIHGQDWARFRGENGEGSSDATTIPTTWKDNELNWKTKLPGVGHSSPIQKNGTIFLQSADPENATRYVIAVNAKDGKINWKKEFPANTHRFHRLNSYNSSTPAADDNHVYFAWSDYKSTFLKAFTHDGKEVWSKSLGSWIGQHGFAASPIVYQSKVIIAISQQKDQLRPGQKAGQSMVYAFDAKNGDVDWKVERVTTRVSYAVPCIYTNPDGVDELVCCNRGEGVYSLDPKTGKRNWAYENAFNKRTVSSPVIADGKIFGSCGSGGGGNYVVAIKPGKSPKLEYKLESNANYVPTPVTYKNLLFIVSDKGIATCADIDSGKQLWQVRLTRNGVWASPIRVQDRIYAVDEAGSVLVFAAAPKFKLLGKSDLGEKSHSTPAIADGKMILRTVSHLISIGGK